MRNALVVCLAAALSLLCLAAPSQSLPPVQPIRADLQYGLSFDTFDDTIRYDNGEVAWWFGGLHNFYLITRFTAPADFALQRVIIALLDSNSTAPVNLWLKEDVLGVPGQVLWSGSLLYDSPQTWLGTTIDEGYAYTFEAGESFWLELFSPGPPYECFDESQLQPPRSFTNYPTPSPGDNFIRAVGEYTSAIVDVGLDSVWHGGLFFVPDSGSFVLEAHVHNYGSLPVQFTVSCSLFSALGEPEDFIGSQDLSLAAGDSLMVSFQPYDCTIEGSHVFRFRTELAGDTNVYNNMMEIETQIYHIPPAAELRYDDGIPMGAVVTPMMGDGWGMRFNPHQSGYYRVESVNVSVDTTSGILPALVQVLAENPVNLSPGAVLWDTTQVLSNGWNDLPVGVTTSGAFYVAYLFENGNSSPALNYDHFPLSGECWSKMSGVWVKGECLEEWMLRAVIDTSETPVGPQLWVSLAPNGPILIPARGGTLLYSLSAGNSGTAGDSIDIWLHVILPGGANFGPILGPFYNFSMPAGYSLSRNRSFFLRGSAAAGEYRLVACLGNYNPPNNDVVESDTLYFQKAAGHAHSSESWPVSDGDESLGRTDNQKADSVVSIRAFPNPFNAEATLRLRLSESDIVSVGVYNVRGGLAARLLDRARLESGYHEINFDGSELAAGIYLCQVQIGELSAIQKMVLLK